MDFSQVDLHRLLALQCDRFDQVLAEDLSFTLVHDYDDAVLRIISDDAVEWLAENVVPIREWAWIALGVEYLVLECAFRGVFYCGKTFPFFGEERSKVLYLNRKRPLIRLYGCNARKNSSD